MMGASLQTQRSGGTPALHLSHVAWPRPQKPGWVRCTLKQREQDPIWDPELCAAPFPRKARAPPHSSRPPGGPRTGREDTRPEPFLAGSAQRLHLLGPRTRLADARPGPGCDSDHSPPGASHSAAPRGCRGCFHAPVEGGPRGSRASTGFALQDGSLWLLSFFFNLSPLRKCRQVQLLPQPGMEARPHRVWGPRTLSPPTSDGGPGHHEATRLRPHQGVHSHPPPRKAGVRGEGPTRFRGHLGGWPGPTLTEGTACCSRPSVHKDPAQRR